MSGIEAKSGDFIKLCYKARDGEIDEKVWFAGLFLGMIDEDFDIDESQAMYSILLCTAHVPGLTSHRKMMCVENFHARSWALCEVT